MNSSNSFNLCPHCGNSNTLNARFCSRCGTQLKVPEEVIVCRTCGTRNSPMANFCRNCGSQLKVGEQTKICPRCRKEVPVGDNTCACGYSFATISTVAPTATAVSVRDEQPKQKGKKSTAPKSKKNKGENTNKAVVSKKGGRVLAFVALVFLLAFVYFFAAPQEFRPSFLAFDNGLVYEGSSKIYGFTFVMMIAQNLATAIPNAGGDILGAILGAFGSYVAEIMVGIMTIIFVVSVALHLIVCITRIFTSKRSKKGNGLYLILAILTTVATALILVPQLLGADVFGGILSIFATTDNYGFGWVLCAIPGYYWFFFLYSLIAKGKSLKEQVA